KGEINMLGFIKNFKVLVQSIFESITSNEIYNFANILSSYGENTFGVYVASSFSKKAMNFATKYSKKIFLIVNNLNNLNNFDEIYNDITRDLFYIGNDKQSNHYHNDVKKIKNFEVTLNYHNDIKMIKNYHNDVVKRIRNIKVTLKNQTLEYFNLNIHRN
ncbi:36866_t:CDS:1, partial [Gigaspora margarita]